MLGAGTGGERREQEPHLALVPIVDVTNFKDIRDSG